MDWLLLAECGGLGSIIGGVVVLVKFDYIAANADGLTVGALMTGLGACVFLICEGIRKGRDLK